MGIGKILATVLFIGLVFPPVRVLLSKAPRLKRFASLAVHLVPLVAMGFVLSEFGRAGRATTYEDTIVNPYTPWVAGATILVLCVWIYTAKFLWGKAFAVSGAVAAAGTLMSALYSRGYMSETHHQNMVVVAIMVGGLFILGIYFWVTEERVEKE